MINKPKIIIKTKQLENHQFRNVKNVKNMAPTTNPKAVNENKVDPEQELLKKYAKLKNKKVFITFFLSQNLKNPKILKILLKMKKIRKKKAQFHHHM